MKATTRVLHAPAAIPSQAWLRDQLIWADTIGAIWPGQPSQFDPLPTPTPLTSSQTSSLEDILYVINKAPDLKLFEPVYLEGREEAISRAASGFTRRSVTNGRPRLPQNTAQATKDLFQKSESDVPEGYMDDAAATEYLHERKLPIDVLERLESVGAIAHGHRGGYQSAQPRVVSTLLTRIASEITRDEQWTLAPASPEAVGDVLRPAPPSSTQVALHFSLPFPSIREDLGIDEVVDMQRDKHFRAHRDHYVQHVHALYERISDSVGEEGGSDNAHSRTDRVLAGTAFAVDRELTDARRGFRNYLTNESVVEAMVSSITFVLTTGESRLASILASGLNEALGLAAGVLHCRSQQVPFLRHYKNKLEMKSLART